MACARSLFSLLRCVLRRGGSLIRGYAGRFSRCSPRIRSLWSRRRPGSCSHERRGTRAPVLARGRTSPSGFRHAEQKARPPWPQRRRSGSEELPAWVRSRGSASRDRAGPARWLWVPPARSCLCLPFAPRTAWRCCWSSFAITWWRSGNTVPTTRSRRPLGTPRPTSSSDDPICEETPRPRTRLATTPVLAGRRSAHALESPSIQSSPPTVRPSFEEAPSIAYVSARL